VALQTAGVTVVDSSQNAAFNAVNSVTGYSANGVAGVSKSAFLITGYSTVNLAYLDHASNPQNQIVVTGITTTPFASTNGIETT
jgi:hypothetical protein